MLILVDSLARVKKYCIINKEQEEFLRKVCLVKTLGALLRHRVSSAGPVTVILKSKGILPKKLVGERNGLAVRLPRNEFLIKIIGKVGAPIVSTSANISGEKNLTSVKNAEEYFKSPRTPILGGEIDLPDLVVDAGKLQNKPSRIVDIRNIRNIKILRK